MEDIVIIGGGVIGTLIAYACSRYNCNVTLIEKENDVANSTSMANSAIIHAGYDPPRQSPDIRTAMPTDFRFVT